MSRKPRIPLLGGPFIVEAYVVRPRHFNLSYLTIPRPRLLNILLPRRLIVAREISPRVAPHPLQEFCHFLAEAVDGLAVHVGLRYHLGHGD